jgi:hypothetical protein
VCGIAAKAQNLVFQQEQGAGSPARGRQPLLF